MHLGELTTDNRSQALVFTKRCDNFGLCQTQKNPMTPHSECGGVRGDSILLRNPRSDDGKSIVVRVIRRGKSNVVVGTRLVLYFNCPSPADSVAVLKDRKS